MTLWLRSICSLFLYCDDAELKGFFQCVIKQKQHPLCTWGFCKKRTQTNPPNTSPTHIRRSLWDLCYQQKHKQFCFMYRFFHSSHYCGIWMTLQIFNSYNNVKESSIVVYILPGGNWSTELTKQHKVKQKIRYWMMMYWIPVYCLFYKLMPVTQEKTQTI